MKRTLPILASLFLLMSGFAPAQEPADVTVVINGQALDGEPPAMIVDGSVFVPLQKVFQALGAEVRYENKIITATRGQRVVKLSPNTNEVLIDGVKSVLETPPVLIGGSTYVPLRFVAQAFGDEVAYDAATKTIEVGPPPDPIDVPPDRIAILEGRLKQLVVGNQGAILKVRDLEGSREVYYRGLDDRDTAPYDPEDHASILQATQLGTDLEGWIADTMEAFRVLPKREAVAFLGFVYSIPETSPHDPGDQVDEELERFLIQIVGEHPDVILRRQALLSMAVGEPVDLEVLESVLTIYETSENLWETFPVQQYFQYHADELRTLPNFSRVRARVAAVNSLYTANILGYLDGQ